MDDINEELIEELKDKDFICIIEYFPKIDLNYLINYINF